MKHTIFLILLVFISSMGFSQFQVDAEIRSRYEYRDGYKKLPTDETNANQLVGQRSRLIFSYQKEKLKMKVSVQDARIWGESQYRTDNNVMDVFEAWAKYNFNEQIALKVGRQVLKYDDQRLFCTANWRHFAQSFDLALLQFADKGLALKIDAGFGLNNNASAEMSPWLEDYDLRNTSNKNLAYLWVNKKFADNRFNVSLMNVLDGHQKQDEIDTAGMAVSFPDKIKYRFTTGPYLKYKTGPFSVEGAFYYQTGKNSSDQDISANFYSIKASYKVADPFSLFAGYDHYSGTDFTDTTNTTDNTFNNLFGPGHKFLGYMDYFGKPYKHGSGINDIFAGTNLKVLKKNKIKVIYHIFSLDKGALKSGAEVNKNLGSEIDIVYSRKLHKAVSVKLGYSFMFASETMEKLKGVEAGKSNFPHFGYISINFPPTLFKQKPE